MIIENMEIKNPTKTPKGCKDYRNDNIKNNKNPKGVK